MTALQKATGCETCKLPISYSLREGKWIHDDEDIVSEVKPHEAHPELRFVVRRPGLPVVRPGRAGVRAESGTRRVCRWCAYEEKPNTAADGPEWVSA